MVPLYLVAVWAVGLALLLFYAGSRGWPDEVDDSIAGITIFDAIVVWPFALAFVLIIAPFYGMWKLGRGIRQKRKKAREWK